MAKTWDCTISVTLETDDDCTEEEALEALEAMIGSDLHGCDYKVEDVLEMPREH